MTKKTLIFLIDTSAILSGKPVYFKDYRVVTTTKIAHELAPGGKDYRNFQLLREKGLHIQEPTQSSTKFITKIIQKLGEKKRVSEADLSILSLAFDFKKSEDMNPIIITDDYSIQNIADYLEIATQTMNQKGITKRFKWERRCRGCGKKILNDVDVCPICGSSIKHVMKESSPLKKRS